jgi:hypothetical protein
MGKASNRKKLTRDQKAQITSQVTAAVTGEAPQTKKGVIQKMKDTASGMTANIKSRMGNEIITGCIKLVKEDCKKGKVGDIETYVAKCKESLRPGTKAGNMIINSGVTWDELEAIIRSTLKDNYAGKI